MDTQTVNTEEYFINASTSSFQSSTERLNSIVENNFFPNSADISQIMGQKISLTDPASSIYFFFFTPSYTQYAVFPNYVPWLNENFYSNQISKLSILRKVQYKIAKNFEKLEEKRKASLVKREKIAKMLSENLNE